eukprot:12632699-Alexandrium_andersonii.AAC.1
MTRSLLLLLLGCWRLGCGERPGRRTGRLPSAGVRRRPGTCGPGTPKVRLRRRASSVPGVRPPGG